MKTLQLSEENARKIYATASDELKQILEDSFGKERLAPHPNLNEPVMVAGIMWSGYLEPSDRREEPSEFNEETGLHYFDQLTSAPLHLFEQGLRGGNQRTAATALRSHYSARRDDRTHQIQGLYRRRDWQGAVDGL